MLKICYLAKRTNNNIKRGRKGQQEDCKIIRNTTGIIVVLASNFMLKKVLIQYFYEGCELKHCDGYCRSMESQIEK